MSIADEDWAEAGAETHWVPNLCRAPNSQASFNFNIMAMYVGGLKPARLACSRQACYFGEQVMHINGVLNEVSRLIAQLVARCVFSHLMHNLRSSGGPCDLLI